MLTTGKRSLGQRLTEDVTALGKTNDKLEKDNKALERRVVKLERAVTGLLQSSTNIIKLYNRLQQSLAQCESTLQSLRRVK